MRMFDDLKLHGLFPKEIVFQKALNLMSLQLEKELIHRLILVIEGLLIKLDIKISCLLI